MQQLFSSLVKSMELISQSNLSKRCFMDISQNGSISLILQQLVNDPFCFSNFSKLDGSVSPRICDYHNLTETIFSLRFDEVFFYLRSNVEYQAGHPGPQFFDTSVNSLSTKKYLVDSYSWNNLLSIPQYFNYLQSQDSQWIDNKFDLEKIYEIHFFSLLESNQRSWKYFLDGKMLKKLFASKQEFLEFCRFEHFHWLAIREFRIKRSSEPSEASPRKSLITVFADSLDKRIFQIPELQTILPNIFALRSKGLLFDNFTSSASWTYPVLSSIYSGINSAIDLRLWRNNWISDIFPYVDPKLLDAKERRLICLRNNLHKHFLIRQCHPFSLTKSLNDCNIYGLKNSLNHSWRHGMSSFYTTSMEKSGFNTFTALEDMRPVLESSNADRLVFIDLDHAHRHTIPRTNYPSMNGQIPFNDLQFLKSMVRPETTLTGDIHPQKVSIYLRRYQDIDKSLGSIMSFFGDDASYILFSDHGSSFMDHLEITQDSLGDFKDKSHSSSVNINKVANPTLIYSGPCVDGDIADHTSELVSSQDLHCIIKFLMNPASFHNHFYTSSQLLSSRLPKAFGGPGRSMSLSTGYSYSGTKDMNSIELMVRHHKTLSTRYANIELHEDIDLSFDSIVNVLSDFESLK